jgi:hypothetical protein
MKRKLIFVVSIFALFAFSIAAYAYTRTSSQTALAAACCCCSGDSCPIKKKDASGKETASCCDSCDCCKDGKCTGDSCPMKKKDGSHADHATMPHDSMAAEHEGCCSCCKGKEKKDSPTV